jgi:hypothetical protein
MAPLVIYERNMGEKSLLIVVALFTLEGILSAIPADAQEDDGYSHTRRMVGLGQVTSKLP